MAYQKPEVLDKYARQVDNNENLYTANKLAMSQSPYELLCVHWYLLFTRLHVVLQGLILNSLIKSLFKNYNNRSQRRDCCCFSGPKY